MEQNQGYIAINHNSDFLVQPLIIMADNIDAAVDIVIAEIENNHHGVHVTVTDRLVYDNAHITFETSGGLDEFGKILPSEKHEIAVIPSRLIEAAGYTK